MSVIVPIVIAAARLPGRADTNRPAITSPCPCQSPAMSLTPRRTNGALRVTPRTKPSPRSSSCVLTRVPRYNSGETCATPSPFHVASRLAVNKAGVRAVIDEFPGFSSELTEQTSTTSSSPLTDNDCSSPRMNPTTTNTSITTVVKATSVNAVLKRCTFADEVRTGAVIPRSVCGRAIIR